MPEIDLGAMRPHFYWAPEPDTGTCMFCGRSVGDEEVHPKWTQEEIDAARAKAAVLSKRLQELAA